MQIGNSEEYTGRYTGNSPYQAANKALSELVRNKKTNKTTVHSFNIIETTQGSEHNTYSYKGKRVKLQEPVEYKIGQKTIVKKYKNQLRKVSK